MAEREAAALELGFRSGLRPAGVAGRRVPERRLGGEHLQHLPGVFLPIGAGMHAGAGLHPRGEQRNERRLDEAPLVMALLRPGVGKEYVHAVQSVRGDHVLHHLDRVVLDDAQVREMQIGDAFQETADAGRMDFDSEIVVLGMFLGDRRGGLAHPETDFEDPGRRAAEQAVKVQSGG